MDDPVQQSVSLYKRALGEAFDSLPPVLQCFHNRPTGGRASGSLCIVRGKGWLRSTLAALMRLPPPGDAVPIHLQVQAGDDNEIWTRIFGSRSLITKQWMHNGLLIESAGPMRFGFRLSVRENEMRFDFVRCWFLGIPFPFSFSPRVNAGAKDFEDGWWIWVSVAVPILGMITRYEGKVVC